MNTRFKFLKVSVLLATLLVTTTASYAQLPGDVLVSQTNLVLVASDVWTLDGNYSAQKETLIQIASSGFKAIQRAKGRYSLENAVRPGLDSECAKKADGRAFSKTTNIHCDVIGSDLAQKLRCYAICQYSKH